MKWTLEVTLNGEGLIQHEWEATVPAGVSVFGDGPPLWPGFRRVAQHYTPIWSDDGLTVVASDRKWVDGEKSPVADAPLPRGAGMNGVKFVELYRVYAGECSMDLKDAEELALRLKKET